MQFERIFHYETPEYTVSSVHIHGSGIPLWSALWCLPPEVSFHPVTWVPTTGVSNTVALCTMAPCFCQGDPSPGVYYRQKCHSFDGLYRFFVSDYYSAFFKGVFFLCVGRVSADTNSEL